LRTTTATEKPYAMLVPSVLSVSIVDRPFFAA